MWPHQPSVVHVCQQCCCLSGSTFLRHLWCIFYQNCQTEVMPCICLDSHLPIMPASVEIIHWWYGHKMEVEDGSNVFVLSSWCDAGSELQNSDYSQSTYEALFGCQPLSVNLILFELLVARVPESSQYPLYIQGVDCVRWYHFPVYLRREHKAIPKYARKAASKEEITCEDYFLPLVYLPPSGNKIHTDQPVSFSLDLAECITSCCIKKNPAKVWFQGI